ncbi:MAG: UDP-3-O-(3-hydroxymyristoyl)glucosamine N-acyltransferase [Gammaproteobacteria bacterium WSBS_2016_MAG_OTU1]
MPSLAEIVAHFGGEVRGDGNTVIDGAGSLSGANSQQLAFYESAAHHSALAECQAGAILIAAADAKDSALSNKTCWIVEEAPRLYFAQAVQWLQMKTNSTMGVASTAVIAPDIVLGENTGVAPLAVIESGASIGDNCQIGAGAIVGRGAIIGNGSVLMARAVVHAGVVMGEGCIIHSGAVIGADGFGFVRDKDGIQIKLPQLGSVHLGSRVEIGANSAIDRGTLDDTIIGNGVKIDNLVQIGHNVRIGDNTVICGCVGISGSVHIGKGCTIGGGAGVAGHITIGDGAMIAAWGSVTHSVRAGDTVSSVFPAMTVKKWRRFVGGLRRLVLSNERKTHD